MAFLTGWTGCTGWALWEWRVFVDGPGANAVERLFSEQEVEEVAAFANKMAV